MYAVVQFALASLWRGFYLYVVVHVARWRVRRGAESDDSLSPFVPPFWDRYQHRRIFGLWLLLEMKRVHTYPAFSFFSFFGCDEILWGYVYRRLTTINHAVLLSPGMWICHGLLLLPPSSCGHFWFVGGFYLLGTVLIVILVVFVVVGFENAVDSVGVEFFDSIRNQLNLIEHLKQVISFLIFRFN